jgi:TRAP-type uncharacterized transport system substrate-binding protein
MLVLGSVRASEAAPLDSPDTVYVDGKPCNKLCQSYTAWFRQLSSAPARRPPKAGVRHVTGMGGDRSKPTLLTGSTASETDPVRASVKDKHVTVGAPANFKNRQPVAAAEKTAAASPKDADHLVGLLMVGPEIKSVSDLTGKNIAIDDKQSASTGNVQRAIAAAGAAEVQLSADQAKAVDRLISGEVSAAVLTLAYPETAEWSGEIAGFKVFRIPLSPASLKERPAPTDNAAAGSNARTIKQQIAAATALAEKLTGVAAIPAPNPALPNKVVAVLIARPDIKSASDLTGKTIAIDDRQSAAEENVRTGLVATGAAKTQLSEGQTKAVDRLIDGEVSAAVLTLVSSEAAESFPDVAGFKILRIPLSSPSLKERPAPADNAAAGSNARTIKQQIAAATALAEEVVTGVAAIPAPNSGASDKAVTLLMARLDIKSVSDLTGKTIAIDDGPSASKENVRTALVAAGAIETQLNEGQAKAVDRLIDGEVSAAVLTSVSSEAAEWFPDVAGFKIFRIPLSPASLKERPARERPAPADNAAASSNARTIKQQIAAATALAEKVTDVAAIPASNPAVPNKVVAVLMARQDIKSVSDLTGKTIAIDDGQSAAKENVRTALVATGATETQLSEGETKAVDRLISGEVSAAVLTLVSAQAAEWFPDVAGFKILRVPLSPPSLKARP